MAIILGSITLPDSLSLTEPYGNPLVVGSIERTIGGVPIIIEQTITGEPITLVGGEDVGWIPFSDLQALITLANTPGATHILTIEADTFSVRFRHEDQPVISAEALVPRPNHVAGDWFKNVIINLMKL